MLAQTSHLSSEESVSLTLASLVQLLRSSREQFLNLTVIMPLQHKESEICTKLQFFMVFGDILEKFQLHAELLLFFEVNLTEGSLVLLSLELVILLQLGLKIPHVNFVICLQFVHLNVFISDHFLKPLDFTLEFRGKRLNLLSSLGLELLDLIVKATDEGVVG